MSIDEHVYQTRDSIEARRRANELNISALTLCLLMTSIPLPSK